MAFLIYNLVLLMLSPAIALYMLYRVFVSRKSRDSWRQQLGVSGIPKSIIDKPKLWIHAVSVGESVASASVIAELRSQLPDVALLISTTTSTGQEMARKSVKEADAVFYYPFDLLPCVELALARVSPLVFASTDTEIWPNFLHAAHRRRVRTAIINGTISDKTMRGARLLPWFYRWAMRNLDRFCAQSQLDADRAIALGADPSRVVVTGNCKADQALCPMQVGEIEALRELFGISCQTRVFVAGSTNPGEDEPVIDAFVTARASHPGLKLILAPRQIERRSEIAKIVASKGLKCAWRSEPMTITGGEDVVILDTLGELAKVYAIADVTFVGGSLIKRGCHSILQPIAQGKPVFFGPYTFKAKDLVSQAKAAGVGFEIHDADELGREIARILSAPRLLSEIASHCERMMQANLGASKRTAAVLVELYREAVGSNAESA
jgi:3-deoxy-D-manno-octulosonic-acid transferase